MIKIPFFSGRVSSISPMLIADDQAQVCTNADLGDGTLSPLKTELTTGSSLAPGVQTIFRYNNVWFSFTTDVDVVKSQIAEDPYDRVYWTGATYPRVADSALATSGGGTYPGGSYRLGVPRPTKPSCSVGGSPAEGAITRSIAYTLTLVTTYGEEGPPAIIDTNDIVSWADGQTRTVTIPSPPSGAYSFSKYRLYRTNDNGNFQFVTEVALNAGTFEDSVDDSLLGEQLPESDQVAPPDDDSNAHPSGQMRGLVAGPNGMYCGFTGNTLCVSDSYMPHSYPVEYQLATKDRIVALASISPGILVTTDGKPWIAQGSSPSSLSITELESGFPNVSKGSLVDFGEYCIYATTEGLALADSEGIRLVTKDVISDEHWNSLTPPTIRAYQYGEKYVGFYNSTAGFIFDPTREKASWVDLDFYATAGFYDQKEGNLYLVVSDTLYKFDSGNTSKTYQWKSKRFHTQVPLCPACAKVDAESYPLTFKLYADGDLKHTETVANGDPFRLPDGYLARDFEIELSGTATVNYVSVAGSPVEL